MCSGTDCHAATITPDSVMEADRFGIEQGEIPGSVAIVTNTKRSLPARYSNAAWDMCMRASQRVSNGL
jgi:hypothetical protein